MQEFQPIAGAAGRLLFGGAAAAGAVGNLRHGGEAAAAAAEVRCPRCDSANTKFCYYNNYNLAQPRHFCKACRRYWTKGGLLRNVPVGGGCRKPKRHAAADVHATDGDAHASHRDAKSPRPAAAPASNAPSAVTTQPSGTGVTAASDGAGAFASDALPLPGLRPPAPMFADQAATFAQLFAPPPLPLPAFSFSAPPKPEDDDVSPAPTPTEPQPSSAPFSSDMAPFAGRSVAGATMASSTATGWPPATSIDAGIFDIAGSDTSYWNPASWTDPDGTIYLP